MLLFIEISLTNGSLVLHFNTSHVTVYRLSIIWSVVAPENFNTSHVTVYQADFRKAKKVEVFQYISCYCLSLRRWTEQRESQYFNTSHVTVYRKERGYSAELHPFQYISCYCLSSPSNTEPISSYYFNTSHVTVYLIRVILF